MTEDIALRKEMVERLQSITTLMARLCVEYDEEEKQEIAL